MKVTESMGHFEDLVVMSQMRHHFPQLGCVRLCGKAEKAGRIGIDRVWNLGGVSESRAVCAICVACLIDDYLLYLPTYHLHQLGR